MKKIYIVRVVVALVLLLPIATFTKADTVTLASLGTAADAGQSNSNGATITITPNGAWASALLGSSWVSFGTTGSVSVPGFFVVPNGTVVSFFDVFNISGTPTGGSLSVLADDSAAVYLNGTLLMSEGATSGNTYTTCSNFGIACLVSTVISLPSSDLKPGSNTLRFDVAQRDGSSFGLDYAGSITDLFAVPEPGVTLLMMLGLAAIGGATFVRKPGRSTSLPQDPGNDSPDRGIVGGSVSTSVYDDTDSTELDEFEIRRRAFFS